MSRPLRIASDLVVRAPLFSFSTLLTLPPDAAGTRARMLELWRDPVVREAIYIASPSLAKSAEEWATAPETQNGLATERSLLRYFVRMAYRCTPFGLFSAVSPARFSATGTLAIAPRTTARQQTRIDNDYLADVCAKLTEEPAIAGELRYVPNTSLYEVGGKLRYAESAKTANGRSYHLVAVEPSDYLDAVLRVAQGGATRAQMSQALLSDPEISKEDADEFIASLVAAQLVVPTLGAPVTGDEPLQDVVATLGALPSGKRASAALATARQQLRAIDAEPIGKPSLRYETAITELRQQLPEAGREDRMLQVDLYRPDAVELPNAARRTLEDAVGVLYRLSSPVKNELLERFKTAFSARYETREMPLSQVLDEELGIGFTEVEAGTSPLLAGLAFGGDPKSKTLQHDTHSEMLERRVSALAPGALELSLTDADLDALDQSPKQPPAVVSLMCRLAGSRGGSGELKVLAEGASSASAARLLGRFCHGSPAVTNMVRQALADEEARSPNAVFAEIVHLPEGRLGNILARPVLRAYEIPYLGISGAPADRQLPVSDLYVSIRAGRIVLRSERLNKEVLPRLTTAHNYSAGSLGVYRFLCTLAQQDLISMGWHWRSLEGRTFLPRVTYRNVVLERARWLLAKEDLAPIEASLAGSKAAKTPAQLEALRRRGWDAVQALRQRLHWPRWIVVTDSDNEMPIDLDNELAVDNFAHMMKPRENATINELYPLPDALPAHGEDGAYTHELLVTFAPEQVAVKATPPVSKRATSIVRKLTTGSEWLYAKFYTGVATSDVLLRGLVGPLVTELKEQGLIDQWFFIRYGDPDWHLRVRFHGDAQRLLAEALPRLVAATTPFVDKGLIWKWQLDTYEREVERYGGDEGMLLAERWFSADSDFAVTLGQLFEGDEAAELMWRFAYWAMDEALDDFGFTLQEKFALAADSREGYGREFDQKATQVKALGERFRGHLPKMQAKFADLTDENVAAVKAATEARRAVHAEVARAYRELAERGALVSPLTSVVQSLLHMHCNRFLTARQRAQEFVLYDFLRRTYDGALARAKAQTKSAG